MRKAVAMSGIGGGGEFDLTEYEVIRAIETGFAYTAEEDDIIFAAIGGAFGRFSITNAKAVIEGVSARNLPYIIATTNAGPVTLTQSSGTYCGGAVLRKKIGGTT